MPAQQLFDAAPQAFTFGTQELNGFLLGWSGQSKRRNVVHEFPNRPGAKVEDKERGPRRLDVRLIFVNTYLTSRGQSLLLETCAQAYQRFASEVDRNPRALLHHPIAGQFFAFCEGPNETVDFQRSVDEIQVKCSWIETDLDRIVPADVPGVPTAAQDVTGQLDIHDVSMAEYTAEFVKDHVVNALSIAALDTALETIADSGNALDVIRTTVGTLAGVPSSIFGTIDLFITKANLLAGDVASFVEAATDLFAGGDVTLPSTSTSTLLGLVLADASDLEETLLESSITPAGASDAIGATEELVAMCLVLDQALKASRPPIILFTVPELTSVIRIAMKRYPDDDPQVRAAEITALNRIPNPWAIPAGTRLLISSR